MPSPVQHYAWWLYACILAVYTGFALGFAYMDGKAPVFSKRNAKSLRAILVVHAVFLAIVLELLWMVNHFKSSLPNWMTEETDHLHGSASIYGVVLIVLFLAIAFLERRWIFVESRTEVPETQNRLSRKA